MFNLTLYLFGLDTGVHFTGVIHADFPMTTAHATAAIGIPITYAKGTKTKA